VKSLNLFLDENGLIRSKGRLAKCFKFNFDLCNPILLPKDCHLTALIVEYFHDKSLHLGVSSTLNSVRNAGFWIPHGRSAVKRVLNSCSICKRFNSIPFRYPKRTDFIADRVNFVVPYKHVGIDFTSHIYTMFGDDKTKMYLLIFTCLNIRAVHIELVPDMSSVSFLLAFVRFCNIFGMPEKLYSDNANTFLQSANILSSSSTDSVFSRYLTENNIKHLTIPLYSPWCGAAWERLIKTIKVCLFKSVGRRLLDYFSLLTLLSDIENTVNARPLTYRTSENDEIMPVCPNSFLKFNDNRNLIFGSLDGVEFQVPNREVLVSTLVRREEIFDYFKSEWYESYLLSLRERGNDLYESNWCDRIKVGDVVLINSDDKNRAFWDMGAVTKLLTGDDGKTRCVEVARANGSHGVSSVSFLYPLQLSLGVVEADVPTDDGTYSVDVPADESVPPVRRSERLAKKNASQ